MEQNIELKGGEKMSEESITIRKESLWKYSTFVLAALLIVFMFMFFTKNPVTTGNVVNEGPGAQPTPGEQLPPQTGRVDVKIGDSPVKGKKDAPVTLVEFSDYQCPFCGRHYQQTYPQILKEYIDSGKVKLVFKDFPLGFHENAQKSAEAARCVREQKGDEGYFKMHDKMFENQQNLVVDNLKKFAREIGADGAKFDSCLDSGKFAKAVQEDMAYGSSIGVQGTPAFFVNGKLISGAVPYAQFKSVFDAELQ